MGLPAAPAQRGTTGGRRQAARVRPRTGGPPARLPALHAAQRAGATSRPRSTSRATLHAVAIPNRQSARVTAAGGALLVGRDRFRPADNQVDGAQPRSRRAVPRAARTAAPTCVEAGEALAAGRGHRAGSRWRPSTAGTRPRAFFAATGPAVERAVAFWDGEAWHREPIEVPLDARGGTRGRSASPRRQRTTHGWSARKDASAGRGVSLFERSPTAGRTGASAASADSPFAKRVDSDLGVEEVRGARRRGAADDGHRRRACGSTAASARPPRAATCTRSRSTSTRGAARVTGTWCDAIDTSGRARLRPAARRAALDAERDRLPQLRLGRATGSVRASSRTRSSRAATARRTGARTCGSRARRSSGCRAGAATSTRAARSARVDEGWLEGPFHVTRNPEPARMRDSWPVSARGPLTSVAPAPGEHAGRRRRAGAGGRARRHASCATSPGEGWVREFLLSSTGAVVRSNLRGVAWPEAARAHAVGDLGAMWLWRRGDRVVGARPRRARRLRGDT